MNEVAGTRTRDIARAAVRTELAQVAFGLFRSEGFEKVTLDDLAAAAGVSRSTFLRYFGTKEDVVVGAFDVLGERVAEALRARPAGEDDWTALRHALEPVIDHYRQDPAGTLALVRLVMATPALCARQREKQHGWRPGVAQALAERSRPPAMTVAHEVRAAAALDCLDISVERWAASGGELGLADLLDEAFAAVVPR
ncbi:TetR/AcrR family transcriptional regulator [Micromonospora sp. NPDC050417]|uniref:TetR/AcrR family transcriptional regulator n=1 Tax=Micromonospora sp. NPDC050417 TaxID=3364280 RepID=UPI00379DE948